VADKAVHELVQTLDDPASHQAVLAERAFLKALGGSCKTPIAAYARVSGNRLEMSGLVVGVSGDPYLNAADEGPRSEAEALGQRIAKTLLARGAERILKK